MRPDQIGWNNSGMKKTPFTKVIEFLLYAYALLKIHPRPGLQKHDPDQAGNKNHPGITPGINEKIYL